MFSNYIKVALRNLRRNRLYSFINLFGMSIGLAVFLLISLWIFNETSYDEFHKDSDNIYRVIWEGKYGNNKWEVPLVGLPVAETLKEKYPEVENVTQLVKASLPVKKNNENIEVENVIYTNSQFFDVFTVEFIEGSTTDCLTDPNSAVISADLSNRLFGTTATLGNTIESASGKVYEVTGIVKNFPPNSHFHFDFLSPIESLSFYQERQGKWGFATAYTYFETIPAANISSLKTKFNSHVQTLLSDEYASGENYSRYYFQPLENIHLHSNLNYELSPNGNILYVYIFGTVALLILVLGIINFSNITSVRLIDRLKEMGIRRVLGSRKTDIVVQNLFETFVQIALASLIAVATILLAEIFFVDIVNLSLIIPEIGIMNLVLFLIVLITLTSFFAGAYPSLLIAKSKASYLVKKQLSQKTGQSRFRKVMVAFQFVIASAVLIGTFTVIKQMNYVQNKNIGFENDQVLVIKNLSSLGNSYETFISEVKKVSGVSNVAAAQALPGYVFDSTVFGIEQPANEKNSSLNYGFIDENYLSTLKIGLVEGRDFSKKFSSDSTAYIINEAAAKAIGWENPIGRYLKYGNSDEMKGRVIGVVENFNYQSLHHEVEPIVFTYLKWQPQYAAVRIGTNDISRTIEKIKLIWNKFSPHRSFNYSFLDEDFNKLYSNEKQVADMLSLFAALTVLIAGLGLFGLSSYVIKQKVKEIAVRKVLGASTANLWYLVTREFLILVIIASLISSPIAVYYSQKWLENFAFRTELGLTTALIVFLLSLLLALTATSYQSIKAASVNPADSLRYE